MTTGGCLGVAATASLSRLFLIQRTHLPVRLPDGWVRGWLRILILANKPSIFKINLLQLVPGRIVSVVFFLVFNIFVYPLEIVFRYGNDAIPLLPI